ncbi:MAG TPA: thiolase family protein [Syntrophomonas sp.]|nr:thiolase family protein [Syntrophomonas sp.]
MYNESNEVVLVSACRTAVGKFGGVFRDIPANELSKITATEAIKRAGIEPGQVDEIVMGMAALGGNGSLPPRIVAMQIGMDPRSGSTNVYQNCASGMRAVDVAAMKLAMGHTEIALAVGTESQSTTPYILTKTRWGSKMGDFKCLDGLLSDGLIDTVANVHMGVTAENIAELYGITREECDALALTSHRRAVRAIDEGRFNREIVPVELKTQKGIVQYVDDEHPLRDTNLEKMAKLSPVFKKGGVVTAANASGMNDASASVILMTKKKAKELGVKPLMKLLSICTEGVPPEVMGLGPAVAIPKALEMANLKYNDVEYWEINEAFAAQIIGCFRKFKDEQGIDMNFGTFEQDGNINNNGSGIGLGHPIGATGVRMITTLYYELERLGKTVGGTAMCVGGGSAMASLWTRDI